RVKPTRAEIEKAVQLYRRLWAGEKGLLDTLGALQRSQGWAGDLPIARQIGFLIAWPLVGAGAVGAAALAGVTPLSLLILLGAAVIPPLLAMPAVMRRLNDPLGQLRRLATALEEGNLSAHLDVRGRSDLAMAARDLNRGLDAVELLISEMSQVFSG